MNENFFIAKQKMILSHERWKLKSLQKSGCKRYYVFGDCIYEREYEQGSDYFELTNGTVEHSLSEEELISNGAIKKYYEN